MSTLNDVLDNFTNLLQHDIRSLNKNFNNFLVYLEKFDIKFDVIVLPNHKHKELQN